jgi:hypothetical protein
VLCQGGTGDSKAFCINEHETICINLRHLDAKEFSPNYSEFLDPLHDPGTKNITVRQAILLQIKSDGRR